MNWGSSPFTIWKMSKKQTPREPLQTTRYYSGKMQAEWWSFGKDRGWAKTSRKHFLETGLQNEEDGQMGKVYQL